MFDRKNTILGDESYKKQKVDREYTIKKREANRCLSTLRTGTTSRAYYLPKRKDYKNICNQKKRKKDEEDELEIKKLKAESEIWKYVNKYRKSNKRLNKNISLEELKAHFMKQ